MSIILDIYTELANLDLGGIVSRNLPEVQLEVAEAELPLRILVPNTKGEGSFVAIGTLTKVEWAIRDLCLWTPLSAGSIAEVAEPMMDYVTAYLTALQALRSPLAGSVVSGFTFQLGPVQWGDGQYWAIDVTLAVEEWL
jgi:hypothetical protein